MAKEFNERDWRREQAAKDEFYRALGRWSWRRIKVGICAVTICLVVTLILGLVRCSNPEPKITINREGQIGYYEKNEDGREVFRPLENTVEITAYH